VWCERTPTKHIKEVQMSTNKTEPPTSTNKAQRGVDEHQQDTTKEVQMNTNKIKHPISTNKAQQGGAIEHRQNKTSYKHQ